MTRKFNPEYIQKIIDRVQNTIKLFKSGKEDMIFNTELPHPEVVDEAYQEQRERMHGNIGKNEEAKIKTEPEEYRKIYIKFKGKS
ncbi:MAG: hypothetical protein WC489_04955 [Patescibacteria group bacterium]